MAVVTQPRSTGTSQPPFARTPPEADIELWWLPLGAGGWFVRLNGRIYEAIHAFLERRRPLDLYHSALQVHLPEGRVVIENSWPIPDADPAARGVVVQGSVGSRRLVRWRVFRYEVRRWRDGVIADADQAVASPQRLSDDPRLARRLLDLVDSLPTPVWGRDELGTGEMWNSNSVVSWLLARSGLPMEAIQPPAGGRTPGWAAGLITALREPSEERAARHSSGADTTPVAGSGRRCCIQSGRGTPKQQPTYRIRSPGRVRRPRRSAAGSLVPRRPGRSDLAEGSGRTHARRSRRQRCGRA